MILIPKPLLGTCKRHVETDPQAHLSRCGRNRSHTSARTTWGQTPLSARRSEAPHWPCGAHTPVREVIQLPSCPTAERSQLTRGAARRLPRRAARHSIFRSGAGALAREKVLPLVGLLSEDEPP